MCQIRVKKIQMLNIRNTSLRSPELLTLYRPTNTSILTANSMSPNAIPFKQQHLHTAKHTGPDLGP